MVEVRRADGTPLFSVQLYQSDSLVMVLRLIGELDVSTAPLLQSALATVVEGEAVEIVLDLTDLRYIDSTGLSLFVTTSKRVRSAGRKLVLQNPQASTRRLLEVTNLTDFFDVEEKTPG